MKFKTKILLGILIFFIIGVVLGVSQIIYLNIAHSSFENYYKFRGCIELINKTEDYGFCKIGSGKIIKLVKFNYKWYLDGDLPRSCGIINCP